MMKFDREVLDFIYSMRGSRMSLDNAENTYNKIRTLSDEQRLQAIVLLLFMSQNNQEFIRALKNKLALD